MRPQVVLNGKIVWWTRFPENCLTFWEFNMSKWLWYLVILLLVFRKKKDPYLERAISQKTCFMKMRPFWAKCVHFIGNVCILLKCKKCAHFIRKCVHFERPLPARIILWFWYLFPLANVKINNLNWHVSSRIKYINGSYYFFGLLTKLPL